MRVVRDREGVQWSEGERGGSRGRVEKRWRRKDLLQGLISQFLGRI